jgi:exodeoxyribonuclease III
MGRLRLMRIITLNVNGIRAAEQKGFFKWLYTQNADFVCIQECKAQAVQLCSETFWPAGYHCFYRDAEKKGYSGVAVYSRAAPGNIISDFGWPPIDSEGRFLEVQVANLSVVSLYAPSGTSGSERQAIKFRFLDQLERRLGEFRKSGRHYVICGDFNIAHRKTDIRNWRSNQNNPGFLPEERAWMDRLFDGGGWTDAFRHLNSEANQYTWWSSRGQAWNNNVGWRIDYQVVSPALADCIRSVQIYREQRFSDHAPVIIDYDFPVGSADSHRTGE